MRHYHRTSISSDDVLGEADKYFSTSGTASDSGPRSRIFSGPAGKVSLSVRPEGGHYTRITLETDQACQTESDRIAKGFFTTIHKKAHPEHVARGTH